jgi:hypothetical protein
VNDHAVTFLEQEVRDRRADVADTPHEHDHSPLALPMDQDLLECRPAHRQQHRVIGFVTSGATPKSAIAAR